MKISVDIEIAKPVEAVWHTITDIENCTKVISSITDLQIQNKPKDGLVGLKWKETRLMFGKKATEMMFEKDFFHCARSSLLFRNFSTLHYNTKHSI
jgi:carbon monoxide dehydrogenase subunit G